MDNISITHISTFSCMTARSSLHLFNGPPTYLTTCTAVVTTAHGCEAEPTITTGQGVVVGLPHNHIMLERDGVAVVVPCIAHGSVIAQVDICPESQSLHSTQGLQDITVGIALIERVLMLRPYRLQHHDMMGKREGRVNSLLKSFERYASHA